MRSAKVVDIDGMTVNELAKASVTRLSTLSQPSVGNSKALRPEVTSSSRPAMFTSFDLKVVSSYDA